MSDNSTQKTKSNNIIDGVEVTNDTLTSRGGLSLFVRYSAPGGSDPIELRLRWSDPIELRQDQASRLIFYKSELEVVISVLAVNLNTDQGLTPNFVLYAFVMPNYS